MIEITRIAAIAVVLLVIVAGCSIPFTSHQDRDSTPTPPADLNSEATDESADSPVQPLTRREIAQMKFNRSIEYWTDYLSLGFGTRSEIEEVYDRQPFAEGVTISDIQTRDELAQTIYDEGFAALSRSQQRDVEQTYDEQFADSQQSGEYTRNEISQAKFGTNITDLSGERRWQIEEIYDRQPFTTLSGTGTPADVLTMDEIAQLKYNTTFEKLDSFVQFEIEDLYDQQFSAGAATAPSSTGSATGQPDFQITDLDVASPVEQGDVAEVTAMVENQGNTAGTQNVSFLLESENLTTGPAPVDIVFVVDDSASMSDNIETVRNELEIFQNELESDGVDVEYAVVTLTGDVRVEQRFSDDVTATQKTLDQIATGGGKGYNYRAINWAIALDGRENARRVIIDLTDEPTDRDTTKDPGQADLAEKLEQTDTKFIAVSPDEEYIANDAENHGGANFEGGNDPSYDLRILAERTGTGTWFDLLDGAFGEKFTDEIATEVTDITRNTEKEVQLDAGDSTAMTFVVATDELSAGEYTVEVSSLNSTATTPVEVKNR